MAVIERIGAALLVIASVGCGAAARSVPPHRRSGCTETGGAGSPGVPQLIVRASGWVRAPSTKPPFVVSGESVYWLERDGTEGAGRIKRVPKDGGCPTELGRGPAIRDFAIDDHYIYWTDPDRYGWASNIRRVPKAGGPIITLSHRTGPAQFITVARGRLYWIESLNLDADAPGFREGAIMTMAAAGNVEPTVLERDERLRSADDIAVAGSEIIVSLGSFSPYASECVGRSYGCGRGSPYALEFLDARSGVLVRQIQYAVLVRASPEAIWWSAGGALTVERGDGTTQRVAGALGTVAAGKTNLLNWGFWAGPSESYVYWVVGLQYGSERTLFRRALPGGPIEIVGYPASLSYFTIDDDYVYWSTFSEGPKGRMASSIYRMRMPLRVRSSGRP